MAHVNPQPYGSETAISESKKLESRGKWGSNAIGPHFVGGRARAAQDLNGCRRRTTITY